MTHLVDATAPIRYWHVLCVAKRCLGRQPCVWRGNLQFVASTDRLAGQSRPLGVMYMLPIPRLVCPLCIQRLRTPLHTLGVDLPSNTPSECTLEQMLQSDIVQKLMNTARTSVPSYFGGERFQVLANARALHTLWKRWVPGIDPKAPSQYLSEHKQLLYETQFSVSNLVLVGLLVCLMVWLFTVFVF
eukprot:TRINITY_DN2176_c0_g1_i1.p2 TRINITY_DN2176_c0_g1~~TRINITY_DN2176_c0_g1_i1.p2  ORF type:complete len:187 (-),score=23.51 TRINITY_DN2176_c0_g1_i1:169-729(-)